MYEVYMLQVYVQYADMKYDVKQAALVVGTTVIPYEPPT
jgi:hypothetical protein